MAAEKAAASGADYGDGLRKRPVPSSQAASALPAQPEDNKKFVRKVHYTAGGTCYTMAMGF